MSSYINNPSLVFIKEEDIRVEQIRSYIHTILSETPEINVVKMIKSVHNALVDFGLRLSQDEILYDFDEHYKVKFNTENSQYYVEIWRTWMGGINFVVGEIK